MAVETLARDTSVPTDALPTDVPSEGGNNANDQSSAQNDYGLPQGFWDAPTPAEAIASLHTTPTPNSVPAPTTGTPGAGSGLSAQIVAEAEKYLGVGYSWGGESPKGFDCSGLVQYVYKALGLSVPRVSYQQANAGQRTSIKNLRPGDLVAWDDSARNPGADHIAIYAGNGYIIEAPAPGGKVQRRKLGSWSMDKYAWGVTGLW